MTHRRRFGAGRLRLRDLRKAREADAAPLGALALAAWLAGACHAAGCTCEGSAEGPDAAPSPASDGGVDARAPGAASAAGAAGEDEVRPVYPPSPENPVARRFCEALHVLPAERRAGCCGGGGAAVTSVASAVAGECSRMLSSALAAGAIALTPEGVDACASALATSLAGCGWVGPRPPELPAPCRDLVQGKVGAAGTCRSSLECALGLSCQGAGPTDAGTCRAPRPPGAPCGRSTDALASVVWTEGFEAAHPECAGYCAGRRCAEAVPPGGACKTGLVCGAGRACIGGRCAERPSAGARSGVGAACDHGTCAEGLGCVGGLCVARRGAGEPCASDAECLGGCVRPEAGTGGRCGPKCGP